MKVPTCGACMTCGEVPLVCSVVEATEGSPEHRWTATVACLTHDRVFGAMGPTRDEAIRKAAAIWADGRLVKAL